MLHAAPPASSSGSASGAALGVAAHAPRHPRPALGLPERPRCSFAEERVAETQHCDPSIHRSRNTYKYAPEAGDPDEGHHTPSTNFDGCHRNCAGHAKRAMVECFEWMDDKAHDGERLRCREGLVDMMRECKLYASTADASAATAAVRRGDQYFTDPCAVVGYSRSSHTIRAEESKCEVCGMSHWCGWIHRASPSVMHGIYHPSHGSTHQYMQSFYQYGSSYYVLLDSPSSHACTSISSHHHATVSPCNDLT
jgi:hypothetical protein